MAATASVVMLSAPGAALAVTGPGQSPCLQSTGSVSLPSTVYAGQSVSVSWTTVRPSTCEGVVSQLNGPGAALSGGRTGGTGSFTPANMGVNTYTVTVFFAAGSVDVASGSVTVQPPPDSISDPAQMCVGAAGGNSADGTPVELEHCNGTAGQEWATPSEDGTIQVMGKCLAVAGGGVTRGTAVQLAACDGSAAQTWGTNNSALINPVSGLCLDATGASTAAGTPLQLWDCTTGDAAQQWTLPQGSTVIGYNPASQTYTITFYPVNSNVPSFDCTLQVDKPTVKPLGNPPVNHVTGFGHEHCEIPVILIAQFAELLFNGFPVAVDADHAYGLQDTATEPDHKCIPGSWTAATQAVVVPPVGYRPVIGLDFESASARISAEDCLNSTVGSHLKIAEAYIQDQGFTVGQVTMQPSNTVPFDIVAAQNLESDNQTVDLVVSEGDERVPDLRGDTDAYAADELDEDGLGLGTVAYREDCVLPSGEVESQAPAAGTYFDPANPPAVSYTVSTCSLPPA